MRACLDCGADISDRPYRAERCIPCAGNTKRYKTRMRVAVWRAAHPEKARETAAAYYAANWEKVRAWQAAYRVANPEKMRAWEAAYYAANWEKKRAYAAAYYAANWEKRREQAAAWRASEAREVTRKRAAAWRATNPEKVNAANRRRRARKKGATIGPVLAMKALAASQGGKCYWCGKKLKLEEDHYEPLTSGGPHIVTNVVAACKPCNSSKGARDPYEFAQSRGRLC